jgi:hypothetical protein
VSTRRPSSLSPQFFHHPNIDLVSGSDNCSRFALQEPQPHFALLLRRQIVRSKRSFCDQTKHALLACPIVLLMCSVDVPAVFRSSLGTGTNFDIAATDQIRPIEITTANPMNIRIVYPHGVALGHT